MVKFICEGLPTIILPVYSVGRHWQTGTKDDFPSLFSLLSMASVNNKREKSNRNNSNKKNFIGGTFLVGGRSIKQTMNIKVIFDDTADR